MRPPAGGPDGLPDGPASCDSFVPRDLFPLGSFDLPKYGPEHVCRSVFQKRNALRHGIDWANAGVHALNSLAGVGHVAASTKSSQMQQQSLDRIFECYRDVGPVPDIRPAEALQELCTKGHGYHEDSVTSVRPYSKTCVSWPPAGFKLVELGACLREPDHEWFRTSEGHLLRDANEASDLIDELNIKPYNIHTTITTQT